MLGVNRALGRFCFQQKINKHVVQLGLFMAEWRIWFREKKKKKQVQCLHLVQLYGALH